MTVDLSPHALDRYRRRFDAAADDDAIVAVAAEGRYVTTWKGHVVGANDGWLVVDGGAFALRGTGDRYVATTFIPKLQRSKAERRAYRWQEAA